MTLFLPVFISMHFPLLVVNLTFNNVKVPVENVLGPLGSGGEVSVNLALSPTKKNKIFHNEEAV